ncbi:MAG: response regulator [Sedimentisphaerales bacterium]|nr:response regulator [Sedimentisphaerales bacterium]
MSLQTKLQPKGLLDSALEAVINVARHKGVAFNIDLGSDLPDSFYCDKNKLTQVLAALSDQAVRRTSQGSVTIHMALGKCLGNGVLQIAFCVEDTGQGVDPDGIGQVLDLDIPIGSWPKEYSNNDAAVALRMSAKLVNLMGGKLEVKCNSGQNTQFFFTIPVKQDGQFAHTFQAPVQQAPAAPASTAVRPNDAAGENSQTASAKVLIIDDVPENRALVEILLKKMGHKTSFATNGLEAVELCKKDKFDVLLMDIQMPVMDGLEATRQLRAEGLNTKSTIIAMTASGNKSDEFAALDAGCDDCLPKPVDKKKLERKLWRIVAQIQQLSDAEHGKSIVSFLEGDPDYQKAIETFIENLPNRVDEIKSAYEKGDLKDLAFKVHALKGLGGFAGFPVFTERAKIMEQSIKANEVDKVQAQVDELVQLCLRTKLKGEIQM